MQFLYADGEGAHESSPRQGEADLAGLVRSVVALVRGSQRYHHAGDAEDPCEEVIRGGRAEAGHDHRRPAERVLDRPLHEADQRVRRLGPGRRLGDQPGHRRPRESRSANVLGDGGVDLVGVLLPHQADVDLGPSLGGDGGPEIWLMAE